MKKCLFLSFAFVFCIAPLAANARKIVDPVAVFSPTTDSNLLDSIGVKKDRQMTCPIVVSPDFLLIQNAQAYSVCYDAQVSCIRWSLLRKKPDSVSRRFIFDATNAYLLTCVLGMEATASGGAILDAAGYFTTDTDARIDSMIVGDPSTSNAQNSTEHTPNQKVLPDTAGSISSVDTNVVKPLF